ncbi:hypothetical protein Psfp_04232 [Pelotomaculum sp. FP]|nr:hypothetical protein Psfp_04232 [Pelotomaculum sp. FP]
MLSLHIAKMSYMLHPVQEQDRSYPSASFGNILKKAHLIDNNITEELETPKIPKRNGKAILVISLETVNPPTLEKTMRINNKNAVAIFMSLLNFFLK